MTTCRNFCLGANPGAYGVHMLPDGEMGQSQWLE